MWQVLLRQLRQVTRVVAALCIAVPGVSVPQTLRPLRIGYFSLPPHTRLPDEGAEQAPVVRYAQLVGRHMGATSVAVDSYPLPRLLRMLESGELDMALMLAKSPSRAQSLQFASQPLYIATSVLVVPAASRLQRLASADDLLGMKIGVWNSGYLSPLLHDHRLMTERIGGDGVPERHLRMLDAGYINAFYSPDRCAASHALKANGAVSARLVTLPGGNTPLYAVFSRSASSQWFSAYEAAQAQMYGREAYIKLLGARCLGATTYAEMESGDEARLSRVIATTASADWVAE